MVKTLGLDIGTNSIGWCLIENGKGIIDTGIRVFPVGVKEDDYNKSGTELSKNASRRNARSIRRLYDRYKQRRKILVKLFRELEMMPSEQMQNLPSMELYRLRKKALDEKISLQELGRIFLLLNQRRGFKSSKKSLNKNTEEAKELKGLYIQMEDNSNKMREAGARTIGEYFYSLYEKNKNLPNWHNPDEPVERIRARFIYRKLYSDEFDKIWEFQQQFYPNALTTENYKKIKENCIFYQRPLKSQKHLVSRCRFEPNKRVAPKSSFEFQEFRIWQTLSNIRVNTEERFRDKLSLEEKNLLSEKLQQLTEIKKSDIKKILKLSSRDTFNNIPEKFKGNTTNSQLIDALGSEYFSTLSKEFIYKLWHTLFFAQDEEWLEKYSLTKLNLSEEQTKKFIKIELEPDYGSICVKAINKILPFLKQGYDYSKSCELAGYHHSFDEDTDSLERELKDKIERDKSDDLRNPLVQQSVSETIRVVNALVVEYGKPDTINIEFARELKKPKEVREKTKRTNDEIERRRDEYSKFLKFALNLPHVSKSDLLKFELWLEMEFSETELRKINSQIDISEFKKFAKNVKSTDKEKYKLYLECGRISPYTGKIINLTNLFSPDIEIEHIIPYSKCMDNSFTNKTLAEKSFNTVKGNSTPYEYFKNRPNEFASFKDRIKNFSDAKQKKFLIEEIPSDFLNSQLNNTSYIAKQVRKKMKTICKNVYITNGQATSILRRAWDLNKILNPDGKNEKSRLDHRHHAIDAFVIANTTNSLMHKLSNISKFDYTGKNLIDKTEVDIPFENYFTELKEKLDSVLISYRNKKRLTTTKLNKYIHSKVKTTQKSISIRGTLHEETVYGKIRNPHNNEYTFVVRKPLSTFENITQIEKIIDPKVRDVILEHIKNNGGEKNIKTALKETVYMYSKKENVKVPIKKVRILDNTENMIKLNRGYVNSGNNYLMAIYEESNSQGKKAERNFETVTFFNGVQKKIRGENIVEPIKDGKPLLMTLQQKDLVVTYEFHPDEIDFSNYNYLCDNLYRVVKFDVNGKIALTLHNWSNVKSDRPKLYPPKVVLHCNYNTIKAVKVRITTIGKIVKI